MTQSESPTITYRLLTETEDFQKVFQLETKIWHMEGGDAVSPHTMHAVSHNGGSIIGAEREGDMVGFVFGFPAYKNGKVYLWSHIAGTIDVYRGQGIGVQLKLEQRRWAIANGYDLIGWTFDPMQRGNANFNLRRLGAICTSYGENVYGDMQDGLNKGMKSDRFKAAWMLNDPRVVAIADGDTLPFATQNFDDSLFLLRRDANGSLLQAETLPADAPFCFVEIPQHLAMLKRENLELARAWQLALRSSVQMALAEQYAVVDFITQDERCFYVLQRQHNFKTYF
ncbi:MAG: hypothetical protein RLP44_02295 [Aggregatilineales bacterium]